MKRTEPHQSDADRAMAIARIREAFAAIGHPIDNFTDEEIEAASVRLSQGITAAGVSTDQAALALAAFSRAPASDDEATPLQGRES
jgi:hypothetical protein